MASLRFALLVAVFILGVGIACRPVEVEVAANQEAALSVTPSVRLTATAVTPGVVVPALMMEAAVPLLEEPVSRVNSAELRPASAPPYARHAFLDVDTGTMGEEGRPDGEQADVLLLEREGGYWLQPVNGAAVAAVGLIEPGYAGCWQVANDFWREPISARTVGGYFCVLTNLDRLAQVKIEGMDGERVQVTTTTWVGSFPKVGEALMTAVPEVFTAVVPTPTFIPDAPIYASGVAFLTPDIPSFYPDVQGELSFLDLDTGVTSATEGDIRWSIEGSGHFWILTPVTRARLEFMGGRDNEPTITDCDRVIGVGDHSVSQFGVGSYLCAQTDEGRLAKIYAENWSDGLLMVRFVTWDTGGDGVE